MKILHRLQFIFLSILLAIVFSVVAKSADSAGFVITRNDDARVVFQCDEVADAFSYSVCVENQAGELICSASDKPTVQFYVMGGGAETVRDQVGVLNFADFYKVVHIRVFSLGGGVLEELHNGFNAYVFVVGQDILFDYAEGKFKCAESENTTGKPLAMSAGFYGAAFVCNAGADTQNGTLWVGDNEFTVVVPPGPCMDIEFSGVNAVPMGANYEVRVEGDGLTVYTVNVAPELPGQVMIQ